MGLFLVVLSYILDGTGNFVDKFLLQKYQFTAPIIATFTGIFALIVTLVILAINGVHFLPPRESAVLIASGILAVLFLLPYFKALAIEDPSRIAPFFQLVPVMVILFSYFLLGEVLTSKQYVGSAIIIASSILLSLQTLSLKSLKIRKAFWYILAANFCTSFAIILFKIGVTSVTFWTSLSYEGIGISLGSLLIFLLQKDQLKIKKKLLSLPKRALLKASVNESVYIAARYLRYFAITIVPVGIVSVLSVVQQVFMLIVGVILTTYAPHIIKEEVKRETIFLKLAAIGMIAVGLGFLFL